MLRLDTGLRAPEAQMPQSYRTGQQISAEINNAISALVATFGQPNGPAKLDAQGNVVNAAGTPVGSGGGGGGAFVASVLYYVTQNLDGTWPGRPNTSNVVGWLTQPGLASTPPGTGTISSQTGMANGDVLIAGP